MKFLDVPRSGSYQGITSSRNRFGQYVRTRATPVNPSSTFQGTVRARLSASAAAWRTLTDVQRDGWASLGLSITRTDSLGQYINLTGFQAFVSVNNNLAAAGDAQVNDAPALTTPDALQSLTPTVTDVPLVSIAYTATPLGAGQRLFLYASPPRSAGRNFENDLRLISVSAAAGASPLVATTAYQARFGNPVATQKVFFAAAVYDGGFLSGLIRNAVIVP